MKSNAVLFATLLAALTALHAPAGVILQDNFSYPAGGIVTNSAGKWITHSATATGTNSMLVANSALEVSQDFSEDVSAALIGAPYAADNPAAAIYAKFTINVSTLPTGSGTYFAHLRTGTTFRARVFANTTGAGFGTYRLGIANAGGSVSTNVQTDLLPNTTYTVVTRYVLATGVTTLWIDPLNETSPGVIATDTPNTATAMSTYAFRQATSEGVMSIDNLVVGTTFADVVPSSTGSNPPFVTVQPVGGSFGEGTPVNFSVTAGGDGLAYQWRKNSSPISGATASSYAIPSATVADSGDYDVVITNLAGSATSDLVNLTISGVVIAPDITDQPQSQTVSYGENAVFSVVVSGTEPLYYQWTFHGTNLPGATAAFYTVNNAGPEDAGPYQLIVTNSAGQDLSDIANLTVNPPAISTIASLRSTLDSTNYLPTDTSTLFTAEGVVVSWNNLTGGQNATFYIQDATAGIAVFWNGGSVLLPQAGDRVRVTAPLTSFNGLLELTGNTNNSLHKITVLSSNNPLPAPAPVPFDFVSQNDPAFMENLEGKYVVASNVFLNMSSPTFVTVSAGEYITNNLGETFPMYINAFTDIPGQTKPVGLVTIFGVMGQFDNSNPRTSGYQLIPTRYADVLSLSKAATVRFTNYLSNLIRPSAVAVNTFGENVLRTGETLTMPIEVSDPDGGTVSITPLTAGLPASAAWTTGATSGTTVTASFSFTPTPADVGVAYTVRLRTVTSTATATNTWLIYVPTADEQQVFISEFLANPTSDVNSPYFNPLNRLEVPTTSITTYDEYIEVANLSGMDFDLYDWTVSDAVGVRHRFYNGSPLETLFANNAIIVYGGPLSANFPSLPVSAFPASESSAGLALNNSGTETITLRNAASNIVDRIVYTGDLVYGGGSLTRFPGPDGSWILAPQAYVGTSPTSAGTQYDGSAWGTAATTPAPVLGIVVTPGNPVMLSFTADPGKTYSLWQADALTDPFQIVQGQQFPNTSGVFYITNAPASQQFYTITAQ